MLCFDGCRLEVRGVIRPTKRVEKTEIFGEPGDDKLWFRTLADHQLIARLSIALIDYLELVTDASGSALEDRLGDLG